MVISLLATLISATTMANPLFEYGNSQRMVYESSFQVSAYDSGYICTFDAKISFYCILSFDTQDLNAYSFVCSGFNFELSLYSDVETRLYYDSEEYHFDTYLGLTDDTEFSFHIADDLDESEIGFYDNDLGYNLTFSGLPLSPSASVQHIQYNVSFINASLFDVPNTIMSENSYSIGYSAGQKSGYEEGLNYGREEYYDEGYTIGYNEGFTDGYSSGSGNTGEASVIFAGILNVAMIPVNFFLAILNFEVFGINIGGFVTGLLTLAIIYILWKIILGHGGKL